jgi:hypothetical protein
MAGSFHQFDLPIESGWFIRSFEACLDALLRGEAKSFFKNDGV